MFAAVSIFLFHLSRRLDPDSQQRKGMAVEIGVGKDKVRRIQDIWRVKTNVWPPNSFWILLPYPFLATSRSLERRDRGNQPTANFCIFFPVGCGWWINGLLGKGRSASISYIFPQDADLDPSHFLPFPLPRGRKRRRKYWPHAVISVARRR